MAIVHAHHLDLLPMGHSGMRAAAVLTWVVCSVKLRVGQIRQLRGLGWGCKIMRRWSGSTIHTTSLSYSLVGYRTNWPRIVQFGRLLNKLATLPQNAIFIKTRSDKPLVAVLFVPTSCALCRRSRANPSGCASAKQIVTAPPMQSAPATTIGARMPRRALACWE